VNERMDGKDGLAETVGQAEMTRQAISTELGRYLQSILALYGIDLSGLHKLYM